MGSNLCYIRRWAAASRITFSPRFSGVPAFVIPYANADEANHAPSEDLEVDLFIYGVRTGAAVLWRLGLPFLRP